MSDSQTTTATPEANAQAGQQGGAAPTTPQSTTAAPQTPPAGAMAAAEPYRAFASEADLNSFVQDRVKRAERSALKKLAGELGFEDADELKDALQPLRRGQGGAAQTPAATATTETPGASSGDAARLSMAIKVGAELNLPAALLGRLQGATEDEMRADAQTLLGLVGSGATTPRPGIPAVPAAGQAVTFTRTQLQDPKFVRENVEAIRRASAEGRIVNS